MTYLTPADPGAFQDLLPKADPTTLPYGKMFKTTIQCHICKGYGGWNMVLNDYYQSGSDYDLAVLAKDPSEAHFKTNCTQCNGWGWVEVGTMNAICKGHEWKHLKTVANCLNVYECSVCGGQREVDSSD